MVAAIVTVFLVQLPLEQLKAILRFLSISSIIPQGNGVMNGIMYS